MVDIAVVRRTSQEFLINNEMHAFKEQDKTALMFEVKILSHNYNCLVVCIIFSHFFILAFYRILPKFTGLQSTQLPTCLWLLHPFRPPGPKHI